MQKTERTLAYAKDFVPLAVVEEGPNAHAAWREFIAFDGLRLSTQKQYRAYASNFLRWLKPQGTSLRQITPALVQIYFDTQGRSSKRMLLAQAPLRRFFDCLVRHGVLSSNPCGLAHANAERKTNEKAPFGKKRCRQCEQDKPVSEFSRHVATADGLFSYCRLCQGTTIRTQSASEGFVTAIVSGA